MQIVIDIPIDKLTCNKCPCCNGDEGLCERLYAPNVKDHGETTDYIIVHIVIRAGQRWGRMYGRIEKRRGL